jgi:hypothetical protein
MSGSGKFEDSKEGLRRIRNIMAKSVKTNNGPQNTTENNKTPLKITGR